MAIGSEYLIEIAKLRDIATMLYSRLPEGVIPTLMNYGLHEYFTCEMRELHHGCVREMLYPVNWSTQPRVRRGQITSTLERVYWKLERHLSLYLGVSVGKALSMFDIDSVPIGRLRHLVYFPTYGRIARMPLDLRRMIADYVGMYAREIAAALKALQRGNAKDDLFWEAIDDDMPKDAARQIVRYQVLFLEACIDVCAIAVEAMTPV